jgi:hypothetical protein
LMKPGQFQIRDRQVSVYNLSLIDSGYAVVLGEYLSSLQRKLPDGYQVVFMISVNSSGVRVSEMIEPIPGLWKSGR